MTRLLRQRLAVLITYYNEGALLTECVESIARQPDGPDEILIYDDASLIKPDAFIPPDVPVTILRGSVNAGPGHGRNMLLAATTCDLVHFHDSDDLFAPGWARAVRAAFGRPGIDVVLTEVGAFRDGKTVSTAVMNLGAQLAADPDLVRFCLRGVLLLPASTSRRSLLREIGGFRERDILAQSEDFDLHVRLAAAAKDRYVAISEPLITVRFRDGSHSSDGLAVWASATESVRRLAAELPGGYMQDLSDAAARFSSRLFQMGAGMDARKAAKLARELGRPQFVGESAAYRLLAGWFGQEVAERISGGYRRLVPLRLRLVLSGRPLAPNPPAANVGAPPPNYARPRGTDSGSGRATSTAGEGGRR